VLYKVNIEFNKKNSVLMKTKLQLE